MSKHPTSKVNECGLRYEFKKPGSLFGPMQIAPTTMSCYLCGKHKPREEGTFKKILGRSTFVCIGCKPIRP